MAEITIRISDRILKVAGALLIVLFLLWGFSHLWQSGVLRAKYQLRLFVPAAQDLHVGAPVRLDGMPVGTVISVELAPNSADSSRRIEVVLRIEKQFQNLIREDSSAALMTEGLLGGKVVNIQRGFAGPPVSAGGEIRVVPVKEATFSDFLDVLRKKTDCQNDVSNSPDAKSSTAVRQSPTTRGPN
jgi:ABC-type transporter Mla subunit MlaD